MTTAGAAGSVQSSIARSRPQLFCRLMPTCFALYSVRKVRNSGLGADLQSFVTVNLDMTMHYRPSENVVARPSLVGGQGYTLIGHHEIMIPLLGQAVIEASERG